MQRLAASIELGRHARVAGICLEVAKCLQQLAPGAKSDPSVGFQAFHS
jgi:hypothetical protein